eukprot:TRINITY_DN7873_c0_g1_i1.p1 TRINITY_DN7873_c0_g1~~TRINITY_DN7873_c0_g1_i1.p1  ORF type:complete len:218 (+),score=47.69 TRINITY_DN7873_c0_g1_i1:220-873(+)
MAETISITIRDTGSNNREVSLDVSASERIERIKQRVCEGWGEWRAVEIVLLRESDRSEVIDGITAGEAQLVPNQTLLLLSRTSLIDAAMQNRHQTGKVEDGDEERWGVFAHEQDKKVNIKIRQNELGQSSASFTWLNEGHTLGNSLRHMLVQNPNVLQCGYSIPHPLEPKMVMEVTSRTYPPDLVSHSLESLAALCERSAQGFSQSYGEFESRMDTD